MTAPLSFAPALRNAPFAPPGTWAVAATSDGPGEKPFTMETTTQSKISSFLLQR